MGFLIYNLFTISSADSMKLLEPDRFDRKEKQTKKRKTNLKKKETFILASDLYRIYSSDPPIISKKTSIN